MSIATTNRRNKNQRGFALLIALFALLLLSALGALMFLTANTEVQVDQNYSGSLRAYYAANSGLLEVRDRLKYPAATPGVAGLADLLPTDVAGNSNGVLYIINQAGPDLVDPADPANQYFDTQLCHDYNSGVGPGTKCTTTPSAQNWNLKSQAAAIAGTPLGYKWVRINMKTNGIAAPYYVDPAAPLDTRVCWDGKKEQLSPGGANPACDAHGMQTVYMLTSLAATSGLNGSAARKLLRFEVAPPSIRPPGAITMDAAGVAPSIGSGFPSTTVDGKVHDLNGAVVSSGPTCSSVAALASDSAQATTQLAQGLDTLRKSIVQLANNSCNADGSSVGVNFCTPGLWWVRGTDSLPRFITTVTTTVTVTSTSNSGSDSHGGSGDHQTTTTTSTTTSPCDSSTPGCYTGLNLGAPELMAQSASFAPHLPYVPPSSNPTSLFAGASGNQADPSIYQPALSNTLPNEIATVNALVAASAHQPNYFEVASTSLAAAYGSATDPAIVKITGASLTLQQDLSGYGILVVPSDFEINAKLQWTGIVLVQSQPGTANAQFSINSGGNGFINGALLLQSSTGGNANLLTSTPGSGAFHISYSCDAIDMAFSSLPFKVVSSSGSSF